MLSKRALLLQAALALLLVQLCAQAEAGHLGGLDEEQEADDKVREVLRSVAQELHSKTAYRYKSFEPISFRRQLVSGYNYFIKARAIRPDDTETIIHARIYKPFRGDNELTAFMESPSDEHRIRYFE